GSVDPAFESGILQACCVSAVALQADGKPVLAAGITNWTGILRLNADGSLDPAFHPGPGVDSGGYVPWIWAAAVQTDGKILLSGTFKAADHVARAFVARLHGTGPVTFGNGRVESNQYAFDVSGDPDQIIVLEASTNLLNWVPVSTNTLGATPLPLTDSA